VAEPHELVRQECDNPLSASVQAGRDAFV
jgi:hypothetical protein